MAKYVNIYEKKSLVIRKAYDCDYGHWVSEHDYMVSIETDDGRLLLFPVLSDDYLRDYTADEYLEEIEDDDVEVLEPLDWKIKENITEWICNKGACDAETPIVAMCSVVALLSKYGMWKDEYAKSIDMERIRKEYNGE